MTGYTIYGEWSQVKSICHAHVACRAGQYGSIEFMFWKTTKPEEEIKDVKLTVNFFEEDGAIVAYCPALDISTCGSNKEEAKKNFQEMVMMFFNDIVENKTYDTVLRELGWRPEGSVAATFGLKQPRLMPPRTSVENVSVNVPVMA